MVSSRRVDVLNRSKLDKVYRPKRANRVDAPYTCTLQAASRLPTPSPFGLFPLLLSADPAGSSSLLEAEDAVDGLVLLAVVGAWLVVVVSS